MALVKFQTSKEGDKALEWVQEQFDQRTASKAAQIALHNYPGTFEELQDTKRRLGELEHRYGALRKLIRDEAALRAQIAEIASQEEMEL